MKNKKIIFLIICIVSIISIISIFFIVLKNNTSKKLKIGKNSTSQEIVDYVLDNSSYEAEIDVEIRSNKNSNRYKIKQTYINNENNTQEVIEPSNIVTKIN